MSAAGGAIAAQVVCWQNEKGRKHLPWQQARDPYRVWLSEIMLQQTQVTTVLDYYARFLERFPAVDVLARASQDEVLAMWSGLGYYSRARNLHRCAQQVVALHGGRFPESAAVLASLPGIGRSTAGAIAAFCFGERVAILDANVRRVLTRLLGFEGDLALVAQERRLWALAEGLLPVENLHETMPRYTQGLMDLGAMVCLPRKPLCVVCPLQQQCQALAQGDTGRYPVRTRKLLRKSQSWWLLLLQDDHGNVWLQRRPSRGIWAGLYCLPVFAQRLELLEYTSQLRGARLTEHPPFLHVLTHRDLHLHVVDARIPDRLDLHGEQGGWHGPQAWAGLGLPAPVRKLLAHRG